MCSLLNLLAAKFKRYFPNLWGYYEETMSAVSAIDFVTSEFTPASPFAAASLNYSGRTVCKWHCDGVNLLTGLCLAIIFGETVILHDSASGRLIESICSSQIRATEQVQFVGRNSRFLLIKCHRELILWDIVKRVGKSFSVYTS